MLRLLAARDRWDGGKGPTPRCPGRAQSSRSDYQLDEKEKHDGKEYEEMVGLGCTHHPVAYPGVRRSGHGQGQVRNKIEQLGEALYFDENLSEPAGQSCASCHTPSAGFVDPDSDFPVSEGVIPGLFGGRNSPASAYAMYAPTRYFDTDEGLWIGGQFWDSRATGDVLGDPLADQALGPFLNPVEMANTSKAQVVKRCKEMRSYGNLFKQVCGGGKVNNPTYVEEAYDCIALSIAAFERTELFGQFNSKYDAYLQACLSAGGDPDGCAMGAAPQQKVPETAF